MTAENIVIENATIVVKGNGTIGINIAIPDAAEIIDGKGKWVIPGLIDMHVHNLADAQFGSGYPTKGANFFLETDDFMALYVANGVTTVLELSGRTEHFGQRNDIIAGESMGPRIAIAKLIDGGDGLTAAKTPLEGRYAVRLAKEQGYDFIKVYSSLSIEAYLAIIDEAATQGMKVVGHIPNSFRGRLNEAFVPNFDLIAHAEEFSKQAKDFSDNEAKYFASIAKKNGTWFSPTLITMVRIAEQARTLDSIRSLPYLRQIHPLMQSKWLTANQYNRNSNPEREAQLKKMVAFNNKLVQAFKKAGVPILAGTDAGTSGVVWGYSLHDELELLVNAGLSNEEALAAATRLPAVWLGLDHKLGTVEEGKLADLILLDANPLEAITNTRKISGVFINGKWKDAGFIKNMMIKLSVHNDSTKEKYDWKKRNEF